MTKRVESTISTASFGQACLYRPLRRGVLQAQEGRGLRSRHRGRRYGRRLCKARSGPLGKARRPLHFRKRATGEDTIRSRHRRGHMGPRTLRP